MNPPSPEPMAAQAGALRGGVVTAPTLAESVARLELSRSRLRESFLPAMPSATSNNDAAPQSGMRLLRRARAWLRATPWGGLLDPLLAAASDELQHWWQRQPWVRSAAQVGDAVSAELLPLVRRHPVAAVLVTAAAGAALAHSGVWRWRALRRSAAGLGAQLRQGVFSQLGNPALQSMLLAALVSWLVPKAQAPAQAARADRPAQADQADQADPSRAD